MKKQYITPQTEILFLCDEDAVLAGSGDYEVTIDENGTSVDDALSNMKSPLDDSQWDDE